MILTVASGKGGTGKTLLATGLAAVLSVDGVPVQLLDCDAEEPNAHLFLNPVVLSTEPVLLPVPAIDEGRCTHCGRCADVCAFHALAVLPDQVLVFDRLCHGCGSCTRQCPEGAIVEVAKVIGTTAYGRAGAISFGSGTLAVGEAMVTPVIRSLKERATAALPGSITILDAPPGSACAVVETMRGSDYVLLVTEPTPFGLHDLRIAVEVARQALGLPVGVVINRAGVGDDGVETFCAEEGLPVLLHLPFDRLIAQAYSRGALWVDVLPQYRHPLRSLYAAIRRQLGTTGPCSTG
ncbi:MAG: nucleotide-binding protein [Anaerolineae bacterium]